VKPHSPDLRYCRTNGSKFRSSPSSFSVFITSTLVDLDGDLVRVETSFPSDTRVSQASKRIREKLLRGEKEDATRFGIELRPVSSLLFLLSHFTVEEGSENCYWSVEGKVTTVCFDRNGRVVAKFFSTPHDRKPMFLEKIRGWLKPRE
jgi:hypothetical protein